MKKIWREYEIVDIDTGEIMRKVDNKMWYTVYTEKKINKHKYVENGYLRERTSQTIRRIVRSKYQQQLEL